MNNTHNDMIDCFTRKYIQTLSELEHHGAKSYGFEYEFLPARILNPGDVQAVSKLLEKMGMMPKGDAFQAENGFLVAFEPGGQIEYCSPPLFSDEQARFDDLMSFIIQTNDLILRHLDIEYIGTDYMPDRAGAPLCLTSERYVHLHERLSRVDSRGLEMMKGTASIHLHVVITEFEEILPLFNLLCRLSTHEKFKMSAERKDIWCHTDVSRCGTPPCCFEQLKNSEMLIHRLIDYALHAEVLGENIAFADSKDVSFSAFLNHMTTLFTDVRFNLKGPTLELRTMDSLPITQFRSRWRHFIELVENCLILKGDYSDGEC